MNNKKSTQKPLTQYTLVKKNHFILKVKGGDGKGLKEWHALSLSEFATEKRLFVSYRNYCGDEYSVEDFFLEKLTRKPKWMLPNDKKLSVTAEYLADDLNIIKTCTYTDVVVRGVSNTDLCYTLNSPHEIFATLEYGKKTVQTWSVPIAPNPDVVKKIFGSTLSESCQKEEASLHNKDYADKVWEAQQNMLQDAKESVIVYGKSNNWTKEQLDKSVNLVDECIQENHLMTEAPHEENPTASEKSRQLLYETRTKILENAKKDKWSSDEINHAIKMIDRLLTKSYRSEDFDITIDLYKNGDEEDTNA